MKGGFFAAVFGIAEKGKYLRDFGKGGERMRVDAEPAVGKGKPPFPHLPCRIAVQIK